LNKNNILASLEGGGEGWAYAFGAALYYQQRKDIAQSTLPK